MLHLDPTPEQELFDRALGPATRRRFLKWSGMAMASVGILACDDGANPVLPPEPDPEPEPDPGPPAVTLDFSNDFGVLNYAYALEQLEAAFYIAVVNDFFTGATDDERRILTDLRDHEVVHREFLKQALGSNAIGGLTTDFSGIDFSSRASVMATAQTYEDLGVTAYNGAGRFLTDPDFVTVAGQIVSVEARHASVIRTLLGNPFAPDAFDGAAAPADVLAAAAPFIQNSITLQNA